MEKEKKVKTVNHIDYKDTPHLEAQINPHARMSGYQACPLYGAHAVHRALEAEG
jgi:hypothetical protein